jgi:hypothetical protein
VALTAAAMLPRDVVGASNCASAISPLLRFGAPRQDLRTPRVRFRMKLSA